MKNLETLITYSYSDEESKKLINLFNKLDINKIRYVVLRGYNFLPHHCISAGTNDIDILVDNSQFNETIRLVQELGFVEDNKDPINGGYSFQIRKIIFNKIKLVFTIGKSAVLRLFVILTNNKKLSKTREKNPIDTIVTKSKSFIFLNLKIDLWNHIGHKSLMTEEYHRIDSTIENEMLDSRILFNDLFFVPSPPFELAHLINRIILDKEGKIPRYYEIEMAGLLEIIKNNDSHKITLSNILNKTYYNSSGIIINAIYENKLDTIRQLLLRFRDY